MADLEDLIGRGETASKPAAGIAGRLYYDTTLGKLQRDSGADWEDVEPEGVAGSVATDTIFDAKGDLAVGTGSNTAEKLTAGANGLKLVADSGETTGLKWAAGANKITNGHFGTNADGWSATAPATVAQSSGTLLVSRNEGGATDNHGYQDVTVVSGRIYLVSCRITAQTHGVVIGILDNSVFYQYFYTTVTGRTHAVCFLHVANSTTLRFAIRATDNTTATVNIDDVVIVEM